MRLGDSYIRPDQVDTILYEARTGRVPVRGAGYRGMFGGEGWDALWTDMSEIVRPTRDGIHGREFISTLAEVGAKPSHLRFYERGRLASQEPRVLSLQVPFVFDVPPRAIRSEALLRILAETARKIDSLAIVPAAEAAGLSGPHVVPLVEREDGISLEKLDWAPRFMLLHGWDRRRFEELRRRFNRTIVGVRVPMDSDVLDLVRQGARVLHLTADYHGRAGSRFVSDAVLDIHRRLVEEGLREEVTLIGGGGIVMAEHVPKAILCGLDVVALDTAVAVALQARFEGDCRDPEGSPLRLPHLDAGWALQRLVNLSASWRDQLLEVLGAMGLREVRRLRGETGRCMFQKELEREAFAGIDGYEA